MADEHFARVPERLLDAVSDRAVRLYGMLDRYAGADGRAFPSRSVLAARLSCSLNTVDLALDELVGADALVIESGKPKGKANHYRLLPTYAVHRVPPTQSTAHPYAVGSAPGTQPTAYRKRVKEPEPITTPLHASRPTCETCITGSGYVLLDDSDEARPCPTCNGSAVA